MSNIDRARSAMDNRAEVKNAERIVCDNCSERLVFHMKDREQEFSMGLTTILRCLEPLILNGALPQLPGNWCGQIQQAYHIFYSDDAMYFDGRCPAYEEIQDGTDGGAGANADQ